jgi:tetratricopeptide (TPR) repeat protein
MEGMNEQAGEQSAQVGDATPTRLAVFERKGANRIHLAIITFSKAEGSAWNLQAGGPSAEAVEKVRPILERFAASRQALAAELAATPEKQPPEALAEMLASEGFIVERLPSGDHQVSFQIDLNTGTVVGTHAPLHPLAAADDSIARRVFEAITTGFSKAAEDLAKEINAELENGNAEAAVAAIKREAERGLFALRPTERLLDGLLRIDASGLSGADRRLIRDCRLHVAQRLGRYDIAGPEAETILGENTDTLDAEEKATLEMVGALGSLAKDNRETALARLRSLVKEPSDLNAEGRGWAWRNISLALSADDPEARLAAQRSADAFLEAGKKDEAGKSLMRLANLLLRHEPSEAVKKLNEMVDVLNKEGLSDRLVRGAALHARANRLAHLNNHAASFRDALEAVELQRGLLGAELFFVSSLHLAALEAKRVGEDEKADALEAEAEKLTNELQIPHFQLARRVGALASAFDPQAASELLRDAGAANNLQVFAAVRAIQATSDPSLTNIQRLEILEETESRLVKAHQRTSMLQPVRFAIGKHLMTMGERKRAEKWFRKILAADPLDMQARDALIQCLWELGEWREAANYIRGVLAVVGDKPGLLFAYGKSLFESGDMSDAVTALARSADLASNDANVKAHAMDLLYRALKQGGTIILPSKPVVGPVTREEFEIALDDFRRLVSTSQRMAFWRKAGKDYDWIERPEKLAQILLETSLRMRFGKRIDVFREIAAGAGRVDLYVKLTGELSILVELKMCGVRYSSSYAAEGEEQLIHYMDNVGTHLGYLVVVDGRVRTNGERLMSGKAGPHTIFERLIDVNPHVKRAPRKRGHGRKTQDGATPKRALGRRHAKTRR